MTFLVYLCCLEVSAAGEIIGSQQALQEAGVPNSPLEERLKLKDISEPVAVRVMHG